jgi:trans-aconitate methyltransferase
MIGARASDHWDRLGARYSENWATRTQQQLSRLETRFIVSHIPDRPACSALDIGVGNGRILEALVATPNLSEIYGVDASPRMLEVCREKFRGEPKLRRLVLSDVAREALPVPPVSFMSAIRVLKYMPNWRRVVVGRLVPALEPDGVLVFSMPNERSTKRFSRDYAVSYEMTTGAELRRILVEAGLEVVDIRGFSRLPDVVHRHATRRWSSKLASGAEWRLRGLFGARRFSTELFVAARRLS